MKCLVAVRAMRSRASLTCSGVIVLGLLQSPSVAAPVSWSNAGGGNFTGNGNWNTGAPPGPADEAVFGLPGPFEVVFDADVQTATFWIETGDVTFDLAGFAYSTNGPSVGIGAGAGQIASLTVKNGLVSHGPTDVRIGAGAGSFGELIVTGANAQFSFGIGDLELGRSGELNSARLVVEEGALVTDVGGDADIHAEAIIRGLGSRLRARRTTVTGRMEIYDGADAQAEEWIISGDLDVTDGQVISEIFLSATSGSQITLTAGSVDAGDFGAAFNDSALTLIGDSDFYAEEFSFLNSTLEVVLSTDTFSTVDPLISSGFLADVTGSSLVLTLTDGLAPLIGQSIQLIDAGSLSGVFSSMRSQRTHDDVDVRIDYVGSDVFLTVVPAPASSLLLVGSGLLALRRRRIGL